MNDPATSQKQQSQRDGGEGDRERGQEKVEEASRSGREETQQPTTKRGLRARKARPNPHTAVRSCKLSPPLGLTAVFLLNVAGAASAGDAQTSTTSTNLLLI